ncbi:MAG: CheR family methyltransferase [Solirubrobacterales bacterium]
MAENNGWEWFQTKVQQKNGIDLTSYKRPQMERRINSFMRSVGAVDYQAFIRMLDENAELNRKFIDHLTINVSEFFRNNNHWDVMRQTIVPELLKERGQLKIWSAGCSTGEEPYSLAMMMKEYFPGKFDKIWATDLDIEVLNKAQTGRYTAKSTAGMEPHMVKKYFSEQPDGMLLVKDEIKNLVRFQRQDLLKDTFPGDFDLILCRNVVIYFTEDAKEKLYRKFVGALHKNGVLFIGSTEQIFQARELGLRSMATFFYQRIV